MGHPTVVFWPALNEFSDNVPPYTCVCPTTCIWQFRVYQPTWVTRDINSCHAEFIFRNIKSMAELKTAVNNNSSALVHVMELQQSCAKPSK